MRYALLLALVAVTSCTDTRKAKLGGYGKQFTVEVVSAGTILRTYTSTDKVLFEGRSESYYFTDAATGKLVEVRGDCIITER